MWDPVAIGRRGGLSKSPAKVAAARRNAKLGATKGGRPPKLPPEPRGLRPPSGLTPKEVREHQRKFIDYYAVLAVKGNYGVEPLFTEEEICAALRRMGRYDLVYRRKKQRGAIPKAKRLAFLQTARLIERHHYS